MVHDVVETISLRELRNNYGDVIRRVRQGAKLVIEQRGHPVAMIGPMVTCRPRSLPLRHFVEQAARRPRMGVDPEFAARFAADIADDSTTDDMRDPWERYGARAR